MRRMGFGVWDQEDYGWRGEASGCCCEGHELQNSKDDATIREQLEREKKGYRASVMDM